MAWIPPLNEAYWSQLEGDVAWFEPVGSASLRLTGSDRLAFLNGQVTQNVQRLQPGDRRQALMLNTKGQVQALMDVHVRQDDVHVWVHGHRQPHVRDELKRHIVFDDVTLTDLSDGLHHVVVTGSELESWVSERLGISLPSDMGFEKVERIGATLLVAAYDRSPFPALSISMLAKDASNVYAALGLNVNAALPEAAGRLLGLASGQPEISDGHGIGSLPQVLGLEALVDHTKGCYLGQEVMARLEARANLKRTLRPFHQFGADLSHEPHELKTADGQAVGEVWQASIRQKDRLRFGLVLCQTDLAENVELTLGGQAVTIDAASLIGRSEPPVE